MADLARFYGRCAAEEGVVKPRRTKPRCRRCHAINRVTYWMAVAVFATRAAHMPAPRLNEAGKAQ